MPKRSTLRLTTRSVAALPVTGKDAVYWDHDLAGFGVRVQRNGRKVYVVQSRGPAGLHRVTLGPCAGVAIDKRRREAATIIDRIKRGLDPVPPEPEPEPTVADLAARCMRAYVKVHCKPKTEKLYRTAIDRHIVPALGTMAVKDVRSKDVIALHDRLRNTPSMANHVVAMLSKMFKLAETWDLVPRGRNPCKAVSHYREQPRERFLAPEEYRNVGAALREAEAGGWMWPPAIAAIRLLMLTRLPQVRNPHPALGRRGPHVGRVPAQGREAGPAHGAADDPGPEGARTASNGSRAIPGSSGARSPAPACRISPTTGTASRRMPDWRACAFMT